MLSSYSWNKIFRSWILFNCWIKFVIGLIKTFAYRCISETGFTLTFWFVIVLVQYYWIANFSRDPGIMRLPFLLLHGCNLYEVLFSKAKPTSSNINIPLNDPFSGLEVLRVHWLPSFQSPWHVFLSRFLSPSSSSCFNKA